MKIGYVRVSKQEQHETLQIDALKFEMCQVEQKKTLQWHLWEERRR